MNKRRVYFPALPVSVALYLGLFLTGCAIEQRDEVVAGVTIPIPGGMSKSTEQRLELTLPGFEGGQVTYRGRVDPNEIVTFYQKELPARGWKPNASLVTRGGILAYTKDNRSVLVMTGTSDGYTTLSVMVGAMGP